jgi:predicted nucleic acid-binding protein
VGPLTLPAAGLVYVDTNAVIYAVEQIEPYRTAALPLWDALDARRQQIVTSELTLLEVLVRPMRDGNQALTALYRAAWLHQLRREVRAAQERAEAAMALATEQGFPLWSALSAVLRGWALAEQGEGEEGIAQMRQGLEAYRATGAEVRRTRLLAMLAKGMGTPVRPTRV